MKKIILPIILIISNCLIAQNTSSNRTFEDIGNHLYKTEIIEFGSVNIETLKNKFKNVVSLSFPFLNNFNIIETDDQIVLNYTNQTSNFNWNVRLVAQFKYGKIIIKISDKGNVFIPETKKKPAWDEGSFYVTDNKQGKKRWRSLPCVNEWMDRNDNLINSIKGNRYVGELYGGGIVTWVGRSGQHGLIASMVDISCDYYWSNVEELVGATSQDPAAITTAITRQSGHSSSAARICERYTNADYGTGIYSDWYLPICAELSQICGNWIVLRHVMSNSGLNPKDHVSMGYSYWSSEEFNKWQAYYVEFRGGYGGYLGTARKSGERNGQYHVRAVRRF